MNATPHEQSATGLRQKVESLRKPETYPTDPSHVEAVETHMAWVFLTDRYAWKLKKPVKTAFLDFSTVEARRQDCGRELRLNRRLAPDVYLAMPPLTNDAGRLRVDGPGEVVDWLVQMRRLPRERMLESMIEDGTVSEPAVRKAAEHLARFYQRAKPVDLPPAEYVDRLSQSMQDNDRELAQDTFGLPRGRVEPVIDFQRGFLEVHAPLLEGRVRAGRVIEAHGDLRPEHVCLEDPPVIIDCLEFNRDLRILDTASELSFLALECERLGAAWVGDLFLSTYADVTGDRPPRKLLAFYRSWHAATRAKIAVWHLHDDGIDDREKWRRKARHYLRLA